MKCYPTLSDLILSEVVLASGRDSLSISLSHTVSLSLWAGQRVQMREERRGEERGERVLKESASVDRVF
jgi:hypothetical protein